MLFKLFSYSERFDLVFSFNKKNVLYVYRTTVQNSQILDLPGKVQKKIRHTSQHE